jgi:hypothetical protein
MKGESLVSIVTALVGVALVAVIVQSRNTASVINASGNAFANSVRAVMGNTRG